MCIEIEFSVTVSPKYQYCWMGKMPEQKKNDRDIYWFGLANDGPESYDYDNFSDFSTAPVFDGKSLKEIWDCIELLSIDSSDPEERIRFYI